MDWPIVTTSMTSYAKLHNIKDPNHNPGEEVNFYFNLIKSSLINSDIVLNLNNIN